MVRGGWLTIHYIQYIHDITQYLENSQNTLFTFIVPFDAVQFQSRHRGSNIYTHRTQQGARLVSAKVSPISYTKINSYTPLQGAPRPGPTSFKQSYHITPLLGFSQLHPQFPIFNKIYKAIARGYAFHSIYNDGSRRYLPLRQTELLPSMSRLRCSWSPSSHPCVETWRNKNEGIDIHGQEPVLFEKTRVEKNTIKNCTGNQNEETTSKNQNKHNIRNIPLPKFRCSNYKKKYDDGHLGGVNFQQLHLHLLHIHIG